MARKAVSKRMTIKRHTKDEAEQIQLGECLGKQAGNQALIYLQGDLGVGKTTLARGFIQGLGYQGRVKSPTYTLVEPYQLARGCCYHLDLYRLSQVEELEYLGLREMLAESAILLIEWPERAQDYLPEADLHIKMQHAHPGRSIELLAHSGAGQRILQSI